MLTLSACLIANGLFAQGAYVSLNTGYGFGASSLSFENSTSGTNSTTYEQVDLSLGKGLNIGGAFGYMLNKNIGAELGLSYLLGGITTITHTSTSHVENYNYSSNMLRINPSVVIASGLKGINPYAKFGFIIGVGSITDEYTDKTTPSSNVTARTMILNGGLALGLNASLGASFSVNDKISLFGELTMVNMSYGPTKGEITAYTYNGSDKLPSLTINDKQTDYVDTYTYTSSVSTPDSQPDKEIRQKYPFGSFGINVGVKYNL